MLNSIVQRNRLVSPMSETEKKIIRCAVSLFLQNGFSNTTLKMISQKCELRQGTIAYHFHTKEDMLYLLMQELMDFHADTIEQIHEEMGDPLLAYSVEIAVQIALCHVDEKAYDLYYNAYVLPGIYSFIKEWTAKKNYNLLKDVFPNLRLEDYLRRENIMSAIEYSAFTTVCTGTFTLDDKISDVLDAQLMLLGVDPGKRADIIKQILELDYISIAQKLFSNFVHKLDNDVVT